MIVSIFALLAAFLIIGAVAARKTKGGTHTDLIVAGRSMPLWIALLTMTATWVDGGYLLGTAEGAFKSNLAVGAQGGICFGVSLVLGGLFFARRMRELEYTTLIDPFEASFGKHWAAVLFVPAMLAEVFWAAELLVAIGSSFGVLLGVKLTSAILLSALVVTIYTAMGGLWSVAYTDVFQLSLVALGMAVALPFILSATGGLEASYSAYSASPRMAPWTVQATVNWWDVSVMLALGGIPWNCYFQRVLSCRTPSNAQWMSIFSGMLTMSFMVPPLLIGMSAVSYAWPSDLLARLQIEPSETLPMLLRQATPAWVALLGLVAIVGAVTSSFSASILSAASMFSWNCCKRLLRPDLSERNMKRVIRWSVILLGAGALIMALKAQSVQALWFFTSDLVFVLLFPQLVYALFDSKVNRTGSIVAFAVSLILRLGGGEPLLGLKPFLPYPEWFASVLPGTTASWYDPSNGALLFPFKSLAALAGMILLPAVSRLSTRALAWGVHMFTALGLIAAAFMAVLIVRGDDASFRAVFILMFIATLIDALDGSLARKARVKEVLPGFDGRRLDDLIDFLTYTCLPLLLIWRAHLVPQGAEALLLLPLLASVYGFSQVDAKTPDGYFLGFPSYWNIIAFYLYYLALPPALNAAVLVFFALMTFVPACYLYTTQPGRLNRVTNVLAAVWTVLLIAALATTGERAHFFTLASTIFPFYYLGASWLISVRRARVKGKSLAAQSSRL